MPNSSQLPDQEDSDLNRVLGDSVRLLAISQLDERLSRYQAAWDWPIQKRASKLDAFEPQLRQLLERYPRITVIRLQQELQSAGYSGGYSILAQRLRELRARPAKPLTVRFETGPGAQAQMDWATYDIDFTQEGRRKVQLFSYILGYSPCNERSCIARLATANWNASWLIKAPPNHRGNS